MSGQDGLNRVADGIFALAKARREQNKLIERQIGISERMCDMQEANLAVTKHLEAELALRVGEPRGSA